MCGEIHTPHAKRKIQVNVTRQQGPFAHKRHENCRSHDPRDVSGVDFMRTSAITEKRRGFFVYVCQPQRRAIQKATSLLGVDAESLQVA